ncbi:MAG: pyridoxamine 5'-phosphate oxidase family protein [Deltaproteobacteria bacterium]|nr:pyridoxamine 5'-phosphate oxidase family protein [Deltaproteobacteria bacterium]MBW2136839.1 pyridoxamine 5'-phosphate oxidase family protein [Deltaproteobacteria bacterium]
MKTDGDHIPGGDELRTLAIKLVLEQTTMTLATASGDMAWSAPVYYVNRDFDFYFFSDPESRHIRESLKTGQASASIFAPASSWRDIKGIQMSGAVETHPPGLEAINVLRVYLKKYPFTEDFFDPGQKIDLATLLKRFRVRLYRFRPDLLYYLDNRIKFSFREKIPL